VHFDEYTNTLTIRTKIKPWTIKGERQAAAVRYMFEQAINDRWILPAAEILGSAYADKKTARSLRMQSLFRGNADWEDYIDNPERGNMASAEIDQPPVGSTTHNRFRAVFAFWARFSPQKLRPYIRPYMAAADARTGRLRN